MRRPIAARCRCSATSGSGPLPISTAYPGFEAFPYPEYSEVFFGDGYKVLRGGAWATRRDVIRTSFRNWDLPSAGRSSPASAAQGTVRMSDRRRRAADQITDRRPPPRGGPLSGMAADVREGLSCPFKELSPRYFYDERGSELFERIIELPEYYPTRGERAILDARSAEIVAAGEAGDADRARLRLGGEDPRPARRDARRRLLETYVPVDISEEITRCAAESSSSEYDGSGSTAWSATTSPTSSASRARRARVIAFLGGTIGNFRPGAATPASWPDRHPYVPGRPLPARHRPGQGPRRARSRLRRLRRGSPPSSTRTCSNVLNREFDAELRPRALRARRLLRRGQLLDRHPPALPRGAVHRPPRARHARHFARNEEMRTEISTKFTPERLEEIYADAGLEMTDLWTDPDGLYALSLARAISRGVGAIRQRPGSFAAASRGRD